MRRIYHHYKDWEDYKAGMYDIGRFDADNTAPSSDLLADPERLLTIMRAVTTKWPNSTEQQLTDTSQNRRAWLGQAACCYAHGASELTTRMAWWNITEEQRNTANAIADKVIREWEREHTNAQTLFGN